MGDREYVDHEDCDRRRIRDHLDEIGLKNVTPFWAVQEDNLADVTKSSRCYSKSKGPLKKVFPFKPIFRWQTGLTDPPVHVHVLNTIF